MWKRLDEEQPPIDRPILFYGKADNDKPEIVAAEYRKHRSRWGACGTEELIFWFTPTHWREMPDPPEAGK